MLLNIYSSAPTLNADVCANTVDENPKCTYIYMDFAIGSHAVTCSLGSMSSSGGCNYDYHSTWACMKRFDLSA